jgi:hypothetical protein
MLIYCSGASQPGISSAIQLSTRPIQGRSQIPSDWYEVVHSRSLPQAVLRSRVKLTHATSVNLSILKFLGFEQIFKNALTGCKQAHIVSLRSHSDEI